MDLRAGLIWKILPPTGIGSPDRPAALSESLYRLGYPGHRSVSLGPRYFRVELYYKIRLMRKLTVFLSVKYMEKQHMRRIKLGE